jgi:hypothetical protein
MEGGMSLDLGTKMVRRRVSAAEEQDDARILAERKARRERLLEQARQNPEPLGSFIISWFRDRRTIVVLR